MNIKTSIGLAALAVVGVAALLSTIPGTPLWKLLNPTKTVTFLDPRATSSAPGSAEGRQLKIVTLLPKDAIPAIEEEELRFLTGAEADRQMQPSDRVIGISINDDHRAYSIAHLSGHEVVNDTIGGVPVAVTW